MSNMIQSRREQASRLQDGKCWYCLCEMESGPVQSSSQCTAEHLVPRSEGGSDKAENIVAACRFCNTTRHKRKRALSATQFKQMVRQRIANGKWKSQHQK